MIWKIDPIILTYFAKQYLNLHVARYFSFSYFYFVYRLQRIDISNYSRFRSMGTFLLFCEGSKIRKKWCCFYWMYCIDTDKCTWWNIYRKGIYLPLLKQCIDWSYCVMVEYLWESLMVFYLFTLGLNIFNITNYNAKFRRCWN